MLDNSVYCTRSSIIGGIATSADSGASEEGGVGAGKYSPSSKLDLQVLYQKQTEWSDWTALLTALESRHEITALYAPRLHGDGRRSCHLSNYPVQEFALGDAKGSIYVWNEDGRVLWSGTIADGMAITSITSFCTAQGHPMYLASFEGNDQRSPGIVGIEIKTGRRFKSQTLGYLIYNITQHYDKDLHVLGSQSQFTLKKLLAWSSRGHKRNMVSVAGITTNGSVVVGHLRYHPTVTFENEVEEDMQQYSIEWFYKNCGTSDLVYGSAVAIGLTSQAAGRMYVLTSTGHVLTFLPRHYLGGKKHSMSRAHAPAVRCSFEEHSENVALVQGKFDGNLLAFATLSDEGRLYVARLYPRGSSCSCHVALDEYAGVQRSMGFVAGYIVTVNNNGNVAIYNGSTGISVIKETTLSELEKTIPRSEKKSLRAACWFGMPSNLPQARSKHSTGLDILETVEVVNDDKQFPFKATGLVLVRSSPHIVSVYATHLPMYRRPRHRPRLHHHRLGADSSLATHSHQGTSIFHILTQLNWVGLLHPLLIAVVVVIVLRRNRITRQEAELLLRNKPPAVSTFSSHPCRIEEYDAMGKGSEGDCNSSDSDGGGWVDSLDNQSLPFLQNQGNQHEADTIQRWKEDTFPFERRLRDRRVVNAHASSPRHKNMKHTHAGQLLGPRSMKTHSFAQQASIDTAPMQHEKAPRMIWD